MAGVFLDEDGTLLGLDIACEVLGAFAVRKLKGTSHNPALKALFDDIL